MNLDELGVSLPKNLEAERAVLGSVLVDNDQFEPAAAILTAQMFFRDAHQKVWAVLEGLRQKQSALDFVTVGEALTRAGQMEDIGGPAYLGSLVDGRPRATNVPHYAGIVRDLATRRSLIVKAAQMITAAAEDGAEASSVLDAGIASLMHLSGQASPGELVDGPQLASEAMAWLDEVTARRGVGGLSGVPTGLPALDEMMDGFQPGNLIVLAARPSQGKSALALQLALAAGGPVPFFSLEMSRAQLSARALATLGHLDGWAMRKGFLSQREYARLGHAVEALGISGLAIDESPTLTVQQIRSKARRWQATKGLKMIVLDYIQLLKPVSGKSRQSNREQEVAEMTRGLKALARDLGVPVLALAQLNRATEQARDKEPTLANLRESGAIEQDADDVLFLHRSDGNSVAVEGPVRLIIAKQRNGPVGGIDLWWYPPSTRFGPAQQERAS